MEGQFVAEITVTRKRLKDESLPEVTNQEDDEIVAIVSMDGIVTLDGYEVTITEAENVLHAEDLMTLDENEAAEHIRKEMSASGIPLDLDVIKLMLDSWHDYLAEIGLVEHEYDDED